MSKDNLLRLAGGAAVYCLLIVGSGAMAQSHDGHDQGAAATEHASRSEQGPGNETATSESGWLKTTVDDSSTHAGHDEQTNAGHGEHDAVAEAPANDAGHGNQPGMSESDWMNAPVVDHSKHSASEHAAWMNAPVEDRSKQSAGEHADHTQN
jgi:hypothetical protein